MSESHVTTELLPSLSNVVGSFTLRPLRGRESESTADLLPTCKLWEGKNPPHFPLRSSDLQHSAFLNHVFKSNPKII